MLSKAFTRLSTSRFIQKIFAIKSRSRRKTKQMSKFCGPQYSGGTTPTSLRRIVCSDDLSPIAWQSLVDFCLLISVNCDNYRINENMMMMMTSAKPGNEVECRTYGGWMKTYFHLKPFVDRSSCRFETM